jgi:hypothetical protein
MYKFIRTNDKKLVLIVWKKYPNFIHYNVSSTKEWWGYPHSLPKDCVLTAINGDIFALFVEETILRRAKTEIWKFFYDINS